jgi:hypothetical protein
VRALALLVLLAPATASAEGWHGGVEARAQLGMHPVRVTGGATLGNADVSLTLDPLAVIDARHDLDLIATWRLGERGWRLGGGWRPTAVSIDSGWRWYQHAVAVATAPLPDLAAHVRATVGAELSVLVAAHGGGVDATSWIAHSESWDLGLFLRIEYAR